MAYDYNKLLEPLLEAMSQGTIPWSKGWSSIDAPCNLASGRPYNGVNTLLLAFAQKDDTRWVTFKQALALGGCVRKGEHGTSIIKYGIATRKGESDDVTTFQFLRTYSVFNYTQIDWGGDGPKGKFVTRPEPKEFHTPYNVVYENMRNKPPVYHGGDRAFYMRNSDSVHMPPQAAFESDVEYYVTLWHELGHATGHAQRVNRHTVDVVCSTESRGIEELVAEMTSYFIAQHVGLQINIDNSAAYCASWYKAIKTDPKMLFSAASKASVSAKYILGIEDQAWEDTESST